MPLDKDADGAPGPPRTGGLSAGRRLLAALGVVLVVAGCAFLRLPRQSHPSLAPAYSARYEVDGLPVVGAAQVTPASRLVVRFLKPVRAASVQLTLDGRPLPESALAWAADGTSVGVSLDALPPYQPVELRATGDRKLRNPGPLRLTLAAAQPVNSASGVGPGFRPRTPVEIVVENSGPARPQAGLQGADVVFEYLSEYSITRMTAVYFAAIPALVGPVRSCRMINPYLTYAYTGFTMCSGVSDGTAGWMFGAVPGSRPVPNLMDAFDRNGHYFRSGARAAPHNLYTSGDRASSLRRDAPQPPGDYAVDPPHDDVPAGQPAPAPTVPLHAIAYQYDPASRQYLRFDHGTPFTDQDTGGQLQAKTVVLMHVPFHDGGWVEDESGGGAHSVWYDMLGSGPAEVYSDGLLVQATWHMGTAGQSYGDNHQPVWFTDAAGHLLRLNTGLTWVHVLGVGQEQCPESPTCR